MKTTKKRGRKPTIKLRTEVVSNLLQAVCRVHGLSEEEILGGAAYSEIQRARHQLRYLACSRYGIREAARLLDASPSTVMYSKKAHLRYLQDDYNYRETFNIVKRDL